MLLVWSPCFGEETSGCETCHKDPKYFVENKKIFNYYQEWLSSPHKQANLDCSDCHGGNPKAAKKEVAHEGVFAITDPRSKTYFHNQVETCGRCHEQQARHFKESHHYQALEQPNGGGTLHAPTCYTCHQVMDQTPQYEAIVSRTCTTCHHEKNTQNLPLVASKTRNMLHRLNLSKGYLDWANIYYESQNWPGDSKEKVTHFIADYHDIIANGHCFHLDNALRASRKLADELKKFYIQAMKEEEEQ